MDNLKKTILHDVRGDLVHWSLVLCSVNWHMYKEDHPVVLETLCGDCKQFFGEMGFVVLFAPRVAVDHDTECCTLESDRVQSRLCVRRWKSSTDGRLERGA